MPLPIPIDPPPTGPPVASRQHVWQAWLGLSSDWASEQVRLSHVEALTQLGEYAMFVLMWHPRDVPAGLVEPCRTCTASTSVLGRMSTAYEQPTRERCPDCYGTHFEGGYRARIIRPSLWTDRNSDTELTRRGEVTSDAMVVETTEDFFFRHGDYIFRADGTRYQGEELAGTWLRNGYALPEYAASVAGQISTARQEDPSSVAFMIPPSAPDLALILTVANGTHFPPLLSRYEDVRGPLIV